MTKLHWKIIPLILIHFLINVTWVEAQSTIPNFETGPTIENEKWDEVLNEFEKKVSQLVQDLTLIKHQQNQLHEDIERLEVKSTAIRTQSQSDPNLINQIRLNNILKELQNKLEMDSQVQRQWKEKIDLFEQTSLSLLSLYNDRIEQDLDPAIQETTDNRLRSLIDIVRKRQILQNQIDQYPKASEVEDAPALPSLQTVDQQNLDGLQLTLDLLTDRQKTLESRIEKSTLQEAEIEQELKLQNKMKDFLEDVRRINEDSDFPHDNLKSGDLDSVSGNDSKSKLEKNLQDITNSRNKDEGNLEQLKTYVTNVQSQILSLKSEK